MEKKKSQESKSTSYGPVEIQTQFQQTTKKSKLLSGCNLLRKVVWFLKLSILSIFFC